MGLQLECHYRFSEQHPPSTPSPQSEAMPRHIIAVYGATDDFPPPPTEKSVVCMQWLTAVLQNPKEAYISVICFKGLAYLQQTTVVCWYTQRGRAEEERLVKLFGVVFAFKGGKKKGSLYKICPKLSSLFPILWFPSILFIKTKPRQQRWQQQERLVTQSKCMQTAVYLSKKKASNSIHLSRQVPNTK